VEKDPFFALAHAGLADAYILIAQRGYQPPITVLERAKSAAKRALELDNSLSEGWVSLALAHTLSGYDWQAAEQEYRHAIELNPRNTQAHTSYALTLLCPNQRPEEALLEIQRALDLEPGSVAVNMIQGMILLFARRYDQAIAKFQAVGKMAPELPFAPLHLAVAYLDAGRKANAVAIAEEPGLKAKLPLESHIFLGAIYAGTGRLKDAQEIATELEEQSRRAYVSPYGRALIQASLGKSASALSLLEEAYAVRDTDFIFLKVDPQLDSLRSLGGFQKLLKKANF
jgi:tetratricopeptide (TPR) repeat protein